ncbi:hypothetical protein M4914_20385 [Streptomyces somaliensis DSM 40738]|uniref:hypothetical protein n=1 Tax=Streptomyces somaliensis TaxID=78355 RepID=UPI0021C3C2D0|nr:hypothetical protein [Streptomyces somaliensis]MCQ0025058.1 hypothetical protein [Streptomyces somaliensis DSM 40738]
MKHLRGFLCGSVNARRSTSPGGTFRLDGRDPRIPRTGIGDQRRYGSAFRALSEFEEGARKVDELSRRLAEAARDDLTTGALSPEGRGRERAPAARPSARRGLRGTARRGLTGDGPPVRPAACARGAFASPSPRRPERHHTTVERSSPPANAPLGKESNGRS